MVRASRPGPSRRSGSRACSAAPPVSPQVGPTRRHRLPRTAKGRGPPSPPPWGPNCEGTPMQCERPLPAPAAAAARRAKTAPCRTSHEREEVRWQAAGWAPAAEWAAAAGSERGTALAASWRRRRLTPAASNRWPRSRPRRPSPWPPEVQADDTHTIARL